MSNQFVTGCPIALIAVATVLGIVAALVVAPSLMSSSLEDAASPPPPATAQVTSFWLDELRPLSQVSFDRAMDSQSIARALVVEPPVQLDLRWEGYVLYIEPLESLAADTQYNFTLGAEATGADGVPLAREYRWGYTTQNPIAGVVQPIRNGTRSTPLVIEFSSPMDPTSVAQSLSFEPSIPGEVHWNESHTLLMYTPAQPLPNEMAYSVSFDGALQGATGSEFPPVESIQFSTPPAILSVSPLGDSRVTGALMEILFDRPMNTQATESAVQIAPEMSGTFSWRGTRLVFEPDRDWEPLSAYTVTVTPEALDQTGTSVLTKPYTWSFQTGEPTEIVAMDGSTGTACETSSSMGMDITIRPLLPFNLIAGDRIQASAVVHNNSTCLRRVHTSLTSDLLTVEGLVTRTLILTAGERRVVDWMATAESAGGGEIIAQAQSGMDGDVVRSHFIVEPTNPALQTAGPVGNVRISREYLDLETGQAGDTVDIGQIVQVRLRIALPHSGQDIRLEDQVPAGLEPLLPQTTHFNQAAYPYSLQEDGVSFHISELAAGSHVFSYLALATYGGEYTATPAEVYSAYEAGLWGRSESNSLTINIGSRRGLGRPPTGGGGWDYYGQLSTCVGGTDNPNDEPYDAMFFEEYGVNPFVDTDEDNLSTFAVDVDTGSYTIMRYYVNDGHIPPDESVRVEEYINYFDQEYSPPEEGEGAFAIHLEGAPSLFGSEHHHLVRVGLQGYYPSSENRPDVVLTFVIDVSGSMDRQNRLELVKDALELLVNELRPTDRIGIAVYGSRGYELLEHTPVSEVDTILAAINRLQPEGSTNAEEGLRIGYRMAAEALDPQAINRVILCSDGVANVGNTGAETIQEQISGYAADGIYLTTVGFGMGNYNDVLMEQLADQGDGFYAYVDTLDEAERLFVTDLLSTLQVIARDARIQVEFNPAVVRSYRLIGYENRDVADEDFRNDSVDAGEIGVGHSVTALYEIKLWEGVSSTDQALIVYVRYEDPDTNETLEINRAISWSEFANTFEDTSPRFQLVAVVAEYAEVLRNSYWARGSSLESVLAEARRAATYFVADDQVAEFVWLVELASSLATEDKPTSQ